MAGPVEHQSCTYLRMLIKILGVAHFLSTVGLLAYILYKEMQQDVQEM